MQIQINTFISAVRNNIHASSLPHKRTWILTGVFIIAALGGFSYYRFAHLPSSNTIEQQVETTAAWQGNLSIYASGTGTLTAKSADLGFESDGLVTAINAGVGDEVKAGDLLATMENADVQNTYIEARRAWLELTSAAAVASALETEATAASELASARNHLEYIISPKTLYWEDEVAWAKEWVAEAQTAVEADPTDKEAQVELKRAQDYLAYAEESLVGAWASYEKYYVPETFTVVAKDRPNLNIEKTILAPTEAQIFEARAGVIAAQAELDEAAWLYNALTGGDLPDYATGSGLTELEQAKLELEAAQAELDGTRIYAPFDGTVMSVGTSVGNMVGSSTTIVTLAALDDPYLEVFLDESDWNYIGTDNEAEVTFDILPEKTYYGKVTHVDPALVSENETMVIRAFVALEDGFDAFNLPIGTSASVEVLGGSAEDAVLIPVEALYLEDSEYIVYVLADGKTERRVVEIGIQDSLYVEIRSGLVVGEEVATDFVTTG